MAKSTHGKSGLKAQSPNKPEKLNKKLIARVSGTTKGEVRGTVHGDNPAKGLLKMAKGGPRAGVAKGSKAAKRATKEVKSYLKATKKAPIPGKKRA